MKYELNLEKLKPYGITAFKDSRTTGVYAYKNYMCIFNETHEAKDFVSNYNNMIDELERRQDTIDLLTFEITKLKELLPYTNN